MRISITAHATTLKDLKEIVNESAKFADIWKGGDINLQLDLSCTKVNK